MPEPIQKPDNQNKSSAAGGAPTEAPKPAPTHEEILTGFDSELKARRILAEKIEKDTSKRIKQLEARKEEIFGAAKAEMDAAFEAQKQIRKEKAEFLETDKKAELDKIQSDLRTAEQNLQALKSDTTDPSSVEQENVLAERLEYRRDLAKKKAEAMEAEYAENVKALAEESVAKLAEIKKNYQANMSIIKAVYEEIEAVKKERETRLKELWSSNLEEKVAGAEASETQSQPEVPAGTFNVPAVPSWVKTTAIAAVVGLGGMYVGSKLTGPAPKSSQPPKLFVTAMQSNPAIPLNPAVPFVGTGIIGAAKPVATVKPSTAAVSAQPVAAAPKAVHMKAKKSQPPAKKTVKRAAKADANKGVVAKSTATASTQTAPAAVNGAKTVSDVKSYHKLVLAMRTIWPKIITFSNHGTILQKSPQYHLQAFCNYIKDHAGDKKDPANLSSEQEAAAGGLLSAIRAAKKLDVLGQDDWDLQELKGILKGGMKADAMRSFTKKMQSAIKAKLAAAKTAAKPAAKVGTKGDRKLMANHLRSVGAFKKSQKGVLTEPLQTGATSQASASVSTAPAKPSQ